MGLLGAHRKAVQHQHPEQIRESPFARVHSVTDGFGQLRVILHKRAYQTVATDTGACVGMSGSVGGLLATRPCNRIARR